MRPSFLRHLLFLISFSCFGFTSTACTIFVTQQQGQIWVGNHEDESPDTRYLLWRFPAHKDNPIGYLLWTEQFGNAFTNKLAYLSPQGGLNEKGLFVDYTAIDPLPVTPDPNKKNRKQDIAADLLGRCATVQEALALISQYNLVKLSGAQLMIVDATGDYAVVHGSYIVRKSTTHFALTNYRINDGHQEACWRRDAVLPILEQNHVSPYEAVVAALQQTAQTKPSNIRSNYSMAVALANPTIHWFWQQDFQHPQRLTVAELLKKGKGVEDPAKWFPVSPAAKAMPLLSQKGLPALIQYYAQAGNNAEKGKQAEWLSPAFQLIAQGKIADAEQWINTLEPAFSEHLQWKTAKAINSQQRGDTAAAHRLFQQIVAIEPNHPMATLMGQQHAGQVTLKIPAFSGARTVQLIGDFTQGRKNAIPLERKDGYWTTQFSLPPGVHDYKLLVNQEVLADPTNELYTGSGPAIFSQIIVW